MVTRYTEADFDRLSWHDCHVWGVALHVGDPAENDWTSDLVLDLDYIVEWICGADGGAQFRVALHAVSIDRVERVRVQDQKVFLDRPYYGWRIVLNWPQGGEIAFGAVGFTQTLRADPILTDKQHLSRTQRESSLR